MVGEPQILAGNQGTIISVSDLFYNIPTRLKGMEGSAAEEYASILKVIQRYAIQLAGKVGFSCRKGGSSAKKTLDLQTSSVPNTTGKDVIGQIFGSQISKMVTAFGPIEAPGLPSVVLRGHLSMSTYHQKGMTFILFINGRLVESMGMKRAVSAVYSEILPKGTHPFVHLSMEMAPHFVDVNVHPTKNEVFFLREIEILEFVDRAIREALRSGPMPLAPVQSSSQSQSQSQNQSQQEEDRRSQSQINLTVDSAGTPKVTATKPKVVTTPSLSSFRLTSYPHQQVHTDRKVRTLDAFAFIAQKRSKVVAASSIPVTPITSEAIEVSAGKHIPVPKKIIEEEQPVLIDASPKKEAAENYGEFTSILELKDRVKTNVHQHLTEVIRECVIVGVFDSRRTFIQYQTQLLSLEHLRFAAEMLYQRLLTGFGYHDVMRIGPIGIEQLIVRFHPEAEARKASEILQSYSGMFLEYFGLHISQDGELIGIPRLLEGLEFPDTGRLEGEDAFDLDGLLYSLAFKVDYKSSEIDCFDGIMRLLAQYFVRLVGRQPALSEYIQHFLFPALKGSDMGRGAGGIIGYDQELVANGAILQLTSTHELYKVFERC
jgi:DNA mismatch repair protein MLH1